MKDTGFRREGPGMGVGGVIPYDNRVLGGVPGVLFWRVLMISSIHAQWFSIHYSVYSTGQIKHHTSS